MKEDGYLCCSVTGFVVSSNAVGGECVADFVVLQVLQCRKVACGERSRCSCFTRIVEPVFR